MSAPKSNKPRNKVLAVVAAVLVIALLAGSFLINSNYFYTKTTALTVGDTEYNVAEFNYFYFGAYTNFYEGLGEYADQVIDKNRPLKDQYYTEDLSFHDYLKEVALTNMTEITAAYNAAVASGMTISEEQKKEIADNVANIELYAMLNGMNTDQYLVQNYGKGMSTDVITKILEKVALAENFFNEKMESFSYTEEELKAYYAENKDNLDSITYRVCYIANGDDAEAAYAAADAIATAKNGEEFAQLVRDNVPEDQKASYADDESTLYTMAGYNLAAYEDYSAWLLDSSRDENDTAVIPSGSGQGYYVLMFVDRENNNYETVSMRHILVKVAADENGQYTEEAKAEAEAKIKDIEDIWKSGARTEDSFAELANEKSEDEGSNTVGGLYETIAKNQMVKPVNDFLFLPRRVPGDTAIVYEENVNYAGYHLLYFVDRGVNYADYVAEQNLRVRDYSLWLEAQRENYPITENYSMRFAG